MKSRRTVLFGIALGCLLAGWATARADEATIASLLTDLKSSKEEVRLQAIGELGARGPKAAEAVAPLVELLKDRSTMVRAHAAWALGEIGELNNLADAAVPALVALAKDPEETVRRQAIRAAMKTKGGPPVVVAQCIALLEDADPGVRISVLDAMADQEEKAVPGLIAALKGEQTAYWACLALREIGPAAKAAVPALTDELNDQRPEVRREALLALAAMGEAAAPAIPEILTAMGEEDTCLAATYALGRIGQVPADAEALIRANTNSDNGTLAAASCWVLARLHPEDKQLRREASAKLIEGLKSTDPFVREASARALVALPPAPEIMVPLYKKAFEGADDQVVLNALDAWAGLGAASVPILIEALKHEKVRLHVIYKLGQIGPAAAPAVDALAALVGSEDENVSQEAAIALAGIGPGAKGAVPVLVALVKKGDSPNCHAAIYALGRIGPDAASAAPALSALLKGSDPSLVLISAWALANIEPGSAAVAQETLPVLIAGLTNKAPLARQGAAEALGCLGPVAKDALPALQKAASDEDTAVCDAAAKAIEKISKK